MIRLDPLIDELEEAIEQDIEKFKAAGGPPYGAIAILASFLEQMIEVQSKKSRDAIKATIHKQICEMKDADTP